MAKNKFLPKPRNEGDLHIKEKLTKKEIDFLTQYVYMNNKYKAMVASDNHLKYNGEEYTAETLIRKANDILKLPVAQEFVLNLQKEVYKASCHTFERAIEEAYSIYQELKEANKTHEMNIAYAKYIEIAGFGRGAAVIQQQIVSQSDKPVQIVYNLSNPQLTDNQNVPK